MKYTNKILSKNSLTTDDIIAALDYKIKIKLLKNKSNEKIDQTIDNLDNKNNLNNQILDNESKDEDQNIKEETEAPTSPINMMSGKKKQEVTLNDEQKTAIKKIILDHSMMKVPAAKNTRSKG
ncbi:unnamed protein product [Brachionus calyciflorus]|uniref:Uncharacterized protein n=1 Tax=Brachionus calyciflorus TaxID=104777 RepID=A0A814MSD8_9BILA|nr:unnamed protein product [Brachionus calyciflorus]